MDISFCKNCDNILYLYKEDEGESLYHCCKSCGSKHELEEDIRLVYVNDNGLLDKSESIYNNMYITHDITLPSIKNNPNIKCRNVDCDADETDIKYIKYDDLNMKFIYICNHYGCKWKNNI